MSNQPDRQDFQQAVEILESWTTGVIVVDITGQLRYVSQTTSRWFGYESSELENEYPVTIFMDSITGSKHQAQHIPSVQEGYTPPRMMLGGRFVPARTKLGSEIFISVGYQNIKIHGGDFVVAIIKRKTPWLQVISTYQQSQKLLVGSLTLIFSVCAATTVILSTIAPYMPELESETTEKSLLIEPKTGLL